MTATIYHGNEQREPYKPQKENFYVYLLCNPLKNDQPFYCGKGKGRRAFVHTGAKDTSEHVKHNPHKHNTIRKIRRSGLEPNLYCPWEGESEEKAFWVEKFFIAMYGRKSDGGILTNISKGGDGTSGVIPSDKSRVKMSMAQIGRKHTPEVRKRISSTQIGKKVSPETREKMRVAHIGKKPSQETRTKMSVAGIGRTHTPESRAKIGAAHIGRKLTPEHIQNRVEQISQLWLVTFPDGHQEEIKNLREFTRRNNLKQSTLGRGYISNGFKAQRLPVE